MNKEKIAVLVDTCCDVPQTFVEQYHMYVIPLKVVYKDAEYLDGVDITPEQVYQGLEREVPKTSLPSGERITEIFDQIRADGFQKVIAITLSSGLSGTNNMIHLIADQLEDMEVFIMDTKNISIGGGFHAIQAARYIEDGLSFDEIKAKLMRGIDQCKVFFVVKTLEYLQKGGRIGLVASLFGNALNLKPIISCNEREFIIRSQRFAEESSQSPRQRSLLWILRRDISDTMLLLCTGMHRRWQRRFVTAL